MRAPGAIFNTHIKTIKGLMTMDDESVIKKVKVDVRFTSDSHETLSFTIHNLQISVPFEKVWQLVEETRKDRAKA